jgi:DNA-binding transcriptional ArsR family regulator
MKYSAQDARVPREEVGAQVPVLHSPPGGKWNSAIALGEMTMTQLATEIGINKSSVSRHFNRHLSPALAAAGASPAVERGAEVPRVRRTHGGPVEHDHLPDRDLPGEIIWDVRFAGKYIKIGLRFYS